MALDGRGVGALAGPRVLGRLTPELILRSPQYMNCVGQYELDMRANRINVIENLGATENQFDSIDLSDNGIVRLEGFPKLLRLKVLHLNSNRVIKIGRGLEASVPALEWLLLTNNKLTNLTDIEPLRTLPRLKYLSLLENPITKQKGYRLYVISRLPHLKVLDFRKVKQTERQEAVRQYPMGLAPAPAATFEPDEDLAEVKAALPAAAAAASSAEPSTRSGPTPEQATAIRAAIAAATTLKEVQRLEEALTTGQLPSQISVPSPMEEGE
ncbi:U2 small nuclear ribonucleoprotein A' [Auxenochlorella protothecoides]|uniref:U2 small nuclear ribonucleoprotein A n=1 Tax=Auxenochlorella protothecoides TaxID=3075 RepID=A0A087SLA3_AUXPR|nr:U2 small nuclear ribonucleoprotein A' [Auxenochlorella protothecoides]KFM26507.1 U2 small nuclear ribonucleoprotein A' [Auxenochlorella protothecoides]